MAIQDDEDMIGTGVEPVEPDEIDILHARVAELEREVERLTAERGRYKAWHDDVASRRLHVLQENGRVYDAIVRPQPLKENE